MSFISNIFLWLLPLISIPLIIHLLNRRKVVKIDFSSILFLNSLKSDSIKKVNILQWLLLIIRTLIVLIIILMMSRPILSGYFPKMEIDPNSSLSIIVVDDSFSLRGEIDKNDRSNIIYEKYNEILGSLNDQSQVCIISISRGVLYHGIKSSLPDLRKNLFTTNQTGNLYKYINFINDRFDKSIINKEVFIISDGQSSFFDNLSPEEISDWKIYLISTNKLKSNLKINSTEILNSIVVKDKILNIEVELENNGEDDVFNKPVNLFINGINVGMQNIDILSGDKKNILFSATISSFGYNFIEVKVSDDDNEYDNSYYTSIYIPDNIRILSVFDNSEDMRYISNVLKTINKKNNIFDYSTIFYKDLNYSDVDRYDVIMIFGYDIFEYNFNIFEEFSNNNRHLIIFPKKENVIDPLYAIVSNPLKDYKYVDLQSQAYEKIDYSDLLSIGEIDKVENESDIKVFKYIKNPLGLNSLISIGGTSSFWDESLFNKSRVDIFYSLLHLDWNDFPVKGFFIQFVNELLYSGYNYSDYNKFVEDKVEFQVSSAEKIMRRGPSQTFIDINSELGFVSSEDILIPGNYQFFNKDTLLHSIAVNIHPDELSSSLLNTSDLKKKLGEETYFYSFDEDISKLIINSRQGYELWKYLLWILCFIVIIEMLISNGRKA